MERLTRILLVVTFTFGLCACCPLLRPPRPPVSLDTPPVTWSVQKGVELKWAPGRVPLFVGWDPDIDDKGSTIMAAAAFWNRVLGVTVFLPLGPYPNLQPTDPFNGLVYVHDLDLSLVAPDKLPEGMTDENGGGLTGIVYDEETGEILGVDVMYDAKAPSPFDYWMLVHELGHVLGLGHDENDPASVMAPGIDGASLPFIRLQSADLEALKAYYAQPNELTPPDSAP